MKAKDAVLIFFIMPVGMTAGLMVHIYTETRANIITMSIIYGIWLIIYIPVLISLWRERENALYGKRETRVDNESPWPEYIRVLGEEEDIEAGEGARDSRLHERLP